MVERFNRTLLMMLAMFAGKNRDDWDDLLPAVMMAYRSSVHESTGFSPYRLMFGEECTLPMDIGLPKEQSDIPDSITSPYAIWVRDALEEAYEQVRQHSGQAVQHQKRLYDRRAVKRLFAVGDWVMRFYTPAKKCKLDSTWIGPYLIVSLIGWALGIQKDPESQLVIVHCQDIKKVPPPPGAVSWLTTKKLSIAPSVMIMGASTMQQTLQNSPSLTVAPPAEGTMIADVNSDHTVSSSLDPSSISEMDVTSAPLIAVPNPSGNPGGSDRFIMCDTPVLHTQNRLGTGKTNDYSPCFQLPCGHITGWSTVGGSSWTVQKGRNVFLKEVNISWGR